MKGFPLKKNSRLLQTAIYASLLLQGAGLTVVGYKLHQNTEKPSPVIAQTLNLKSASSPKLLYRKNIEATILELKSLSLNKSELTQIEALRKKPEGILLYKKLLKKSKDLNRKMVINKRPYLTKISSNLVTKLEIVPNLSAKEVTSRISESLDLLKVMKDAALNSNMKEYEKINFIEMISAISTLLSDLDLIEKNIQSVSAQLLALKTEFDQKKQSQISQIYQGLRKSSEEIHLILMSQLLLLAATLGLTFITKNKTTSLMNENSKSLEDTLAKIILDKDKGPLDQLTNSVVKRSIKRNLQEADGEHFINEFLSSSIPFPAFIVNQNKIIIWANKSMKERGSIDNELIKKQLLTSDMLFKILGLNSAHDLDSVSQPMKSLSSGEEISFFKDSNFPGCFVAIVQAAKEEVLPKTKSYTEAMPPPLPFEARPKYLAGSSDEISLNFCLSKQILIQTRQLIDKNVKIDLNVDEKILVNVNEEKFNELLKTTLLGLTGDSLPNKNKLIKISGLRENSMYYLVFDHFNPINQVLSEVLNHLSAEAGVNYQISGNRMLMGMLTENLGYHLERGPLLDL